MYYAVSTFGTQTSVIGLATSTTLEAGSWVDHGTAGIGSNAGNSKYNAIDPALLVVSSSGMLRLLSIMALTTSTDFPRIMTTQF